MTLQEKTADLTKEQREKLAEMRNDHQFQHH